MSRWLKSPASFRDPHGFVFSAEGVVYRQVNEAGGPDFEWLMESGLYRELADAGMIVEHEQVPLRLDGAPPARAVLRPRRIPFISFPYEWCHSQLKRAALLTLELQRRALERGGTLRDGSAYNIQFLEGRPVLIDTLSLAPRRPGLPWVAYRQFCQHFLAPLAAMSYVDPSLGRLLAVHLDGLPLDVGARLLPASTRLRPSLLFHIHLHARSSARWSKAGADPRAVRSRGMSDRALLGLVDSLRSAVERLDCRASGTAWSDYYQNTNYSAGAEQGKQTTVRGLISEAARRGSLATVWDLGANIGAYSRIAAESSPVVIAFDADHGVVERHFRDCTSRHDTRVLPLLQDLTNPTPGLGWCNRERQSLLTRGPADLSLALALVHHLAIGSNVPLGDIAEFLALSSRRSIVEFVPRDDSQVVRMLRHREDLFADYTQEAFEHAFSRVFRILIAVPVPESRRRLYLMEAQ